VITWNWCVFFMDLGTNRKFCRTQHWTIGFYNRGVECLLRGTDWVLIRHIHVSSLKCAFSIIETLKKEAALLKETTVLPPELHGQSTVTHISVSFVTCLGLNHVFTAFWTRCPLHVTSKLHVTPKYFINTRLLLMTRLRISGAAPYPLPSRRGQRQLYLPLFLCRQLIISEICCSLGCIAILSGVSCHQLLPRKWRRQILPKVGFLYQTRRRRNLEHNFYSNNPSYRSSNGSKAVELR